MEGLSYWKRSLNLHWKTRGSPGQFWDALVGGLDWIRKNLTETMLGIVFIKREREYGEAG